MEISGWDKTRLNTVNRCRNRGKYDYQTVNTIVDETPVLHVSFSAPQEEGGSSFPVILPMVGCTSNYPDPALPDKSESRVVYLHGYVSSRILRLAQTSDQNGTEDVDGVGASVNLNKGIPICVAATQLDGIVLALTPNHHSANYRSAVVFGHAHVVTDEAERLHALELITNSFVPSRWENTRYPNSTELKSTGILRVEIESASAKIRTGTTGEDRKDLKDEEMKQRVWAGVVPAYLQYGKPEPAPTNMVEEVPRYIEKWVEDENKKNYEHACEAAK
ncbi:MAG: hypothetical protein Q9184_005988 [Pyrenodesmia sp. 2 TL-2023]